MKKNNLALILMMIVTMMIFFVLETDMAIANEYISLLPNLILIVITINGVQRTNGGAPTLGAFIMLGVGFALLIGNLNTLGIIIPDLLTASLTLRYLQALIVFFSAIIGTITA